MKFAISIAIFLIVLSSVPLFARQSGASAQAGASAGAGGVQASQSAGASARAGSASAQADSSADAPAQFEPVSCELVNKLDSKSAKAGDAVVVKTREKVRTAEGTLIPKGSRLVGHVTEVEARGQGHAGSSMTIAFDRAELKGGQSLAIHSVIESIAPPVSAASAASIDSDESMGAPLGGGMAEPSRPMGVGRSGGGVVGGTVGAATSNAAGVGSNVGATSDTALQGTSTAVRSTEGIAAGTQATAANGLHGAVEGTGALAMRGSAVPGVALAADATGTTSGTLSASRKDVHLDAGTQMVLAVAAASPAR